MSLESSISRAESGFFGDLHKATPADLIELRAIQGWSQNDLAAVLGVGGALVCMMERGKRTIVHHRHAFIRLALFCARNVPALRRVGPVEWLAATVGQVDLDDPSLRPRRRRRWTGKITRR